MPATPTLPPSTEPSWLSSIHGWLAKDDNWKYVLAIGAGTTILGGLGYYVYMSKQENGTPRSSSSKKKKSKSKTVKEEPPASTEKNHAETVVSDESDGFVATTKRNEDVVEEAEAGEEIEENGNVNTEDLTQMTLQQREELAQSAKSRGNKYYSGRKFQKAAEMYSMAIKYSPKGSPKISVYYSNRAACFANLNQFDKVVEDCTLALAIDPKYVKALGRRANGYEKLGSFVESLHDYTMACILEEFKNTSYMEAAERVLRQLASQGAQEVLKKEDRNLEFPSLSFISAYLSSFRYEYLNREQLTEKPDNEGDALFIEAVNAFKHKQWEKSFAKCCAALEAGVQLFKAHALNMRGTFYFLMNRVTDARADYEASFAEDSQCVNTMIKIASVLMEREQEMPSISETLDWFERAEKMSPNDPDVYYHRGQIYFLTQEYDKAMGQYEKSIEIDSTFLFAKIQLAVVHYRLGDAAKSNLMFEELKASYPKSADVHYYHGELLLDQSDVDAAMREFDKAIRLNKKLPLPHLNKGIVAFHLKNNFEEAVAHTQKAIEVDPRCELAYLHLAQMYTQTVKLDEAIITYKRAIDMSRTQQDIENAIMGLEAARAQLAAMQRLNGIKQNESQDQNE